MTESVNLLRRILSDACDRHGLMGFSANGTPVPVELALEPDGALPAIALYAKGVWRILGLTPRELYQLPDEDGDDWDDGFPWVIEEDENALFGQSVHLRDCPSIPPSLFYLVVDYVVERIAVTSRLHQSIEMDQPVIAELTNLIDIVLQDQEVTHVSPGI